VPIAPVAIQAPVGRAPADADGLAGGSLGVELGATTPRRLGLGLALASGVGIGPTTEGWPRSSRKNAPPTATIATTTAAATVILDMGRILGADHQARR
jgi:hypothetical protein